MAIGLLCIGLILMGSLKTQAHYSPLKRIQNLILSKVPLQPDFQDEKFQGKWFVVGGADNRIPKEGKPAMNRITYELEDDHSFNVTSTWVNDQGCDHWSSTVVPSGQPGQFTMANITSFSGVQNFIMRVVATDYNQFAIVFYRIVQDGVQSVATLLGRTTELNPELRKRFVNFAMTLGFTDENIFFSDPMEKCMDV